MAGSDEPIDHVLRTYPPWDPTVKTECGKEEVAGRILTRDEFVAKVKKQGQQRSALTTCMTCWSTAKRYRSWQASPTEAVVRWLGNGYSSSEHDTELRAIAALIEAHRQEYDDFIADSAETADLAARRRKRAQENARVTGPRRL